MKALDLFCGAGGATKGLQRAGFHVTGVDINSQPHYCGDRFIQADALASGLDLSEFDFIWASPPCQLFSQMSARWRGQGVNGERIDFLTPTKAMLAPIEAGWAIENVVGAKQMLRGAFTLHGGMFGLGVHRPRLFLTNFLVLTPQAPIVKQPIGVWDNRPHGEDRPFRKRLNGNFKGRSEMRIARTLEEAQTAMGMDWADWMGTKEAIPPAYSEFIARAWLGPCLNRIEHGRVASR